MNNFKDCNGVCPQDYEEVYSSSQGSVLNECSQCVHQNNVDDMFTEIKYAKWNMY